MKIIILYSSFAFSAMLAQSQVTSGLVVDYSFNSGTASDGMGVSNGTVTGASLTSDRFNNTSKAYQFNGSSNINCGKPGAVNSLTSALSVSAWFKRASFSSQLEVITAKWAFAPVSEHFFLATQNNKIVWASPGPGNQGTTDTSKLQANTWIHVVYTWAASGAVRIYINGTLSSSVQLSSHTVSITSPVNMMIGAQDAGTRLFNGSIDDVRIYNRVLSDSEAQSLFNEPNPATVGLKENMSGVRNFKVFPNPAQNEIVLLSGETSVAQLINQFGQMVKQVNLEAGQAKTLDISSLEAGIYFVNLGNASKKVVVTR